MQFTRKTDLLVFQPLHLLTIGYITVQEECIGFELLFVFLLFIYIFVYLSIYLHFLPYTAGSFHRDYTRLTGPLCMIKFFLSCRKARYIYRVIIGKIFIQFVQSHS